MQTELTIDNSPGRYRPAFPLGVADYGKAPESNTIQEPSIGAIYPSGPGTPQHRRSSLLRADQAARDHSNHPEIPHEHKPLLEMEGLHGAGAGIGVGSGAGGFAHNDSHITSELSTIYSDIQKILDIRKKYIGLSLQGDGDNPKDGPNWNIYPPPPEPAWHEGNSLANSAILSQERPYSRDTRPRPSGSSASQTSHPKPARPKRKPGQEIGADFYIEDLLPVPGPVDGTFKLDANGVYQVYENSQSEELGTPLINIPTIREFYMDLETTLNISSDGPTKSFAFRRLQYLEGKFNLYVLLNEYQEMADSKRVPHRDFYNVRKVDTHVHHSACMNQKHLLRFIKSKMKKCPDEVVMFRDGKHLTLEEVFQSIKLTAYDLSIDTLDMHVSTSRLHNCHRN